MMMFWERIIRTTLNETRENLGYKITMRTMVKSRGKTPIQVVPLYLFFVHKKKKKKKITTRQSTVIMTIYDKLGLIVTLSHYPSLPKKLGL